MHIYPAGGHGLSLANEETKRQDAAASNQSARAGWNWLADGCHGCKKWE